MKIEMTEEQYDTMRTALLHAQVALGGDVDILNKNGFPGLATFRAEQLAIVNKALASSDFGKVKIVRENI